jgi:hypothetical protein
MTRRAALLALSLALAIAAGGCGSNANDTKTPAGAQDRPRAPVRFTYPVFVRGNFMVNCINHAAGGLGVDRAGELCQCMFSELTKRYTFRQFLAADRAAALGHPLPKRFMAVITACVHPPPA